MIEGWKFKKLGSVCKTGAGGTPLKSHKEYYTNGTIPWLRSGEVNNKNITESEIKITDLGLNNSSAKLFPPGTVVIAMYGATAGEVGILNFECASNQAVCGILPNENFIPEFLYYFFLKFKADLIAQAVGNAQPNISQAKIKDTLVPVISIDEQQQIVTILDQAFEAIDRAKANIEKNIENAKELFQSKLNEIFSQRGEGWEEKEISEIGEVQTGTTPSTKDQSNYGDFIPFAKPPHFSKNGSINTGDSMLSKKGMEKGRLFRANSVLMVCIGATIGKTGFSEKPISSNQQINALTPNEMYVSKLLYYALISPFVQKQVMTIGKSAQATLPIINKSKWQKLKVILPIDQSEQYRIIETLENLKECHIQYKIIYQKKLLILEELKKSILQKAFAGELTNETVEV
jgi:type I restriction enzyme S subunit